MQIIIRAAALASILATLAGASPALAERPITGAEAQRLLAGRSFQLQCIDGTSGRGVFNTHGAVSVSYRRGGASEMMQEQRDRATVHAQGNEICINWTQFDGGGNSCYPVAERAAGSFRIGGINRWCDIYAR
jgi:hypothetical protein